MQWLFTLSHKPLYHSQELWVPMQYWNTVHALDMYILLILVDVFVLEYYKWKFAETFLFATTSRPALGTAHFLIKSVAGAISLEVRRQIMEF
jgi:hypothetical protein